VCSGSKALRYQVFMPRRSAVHCACIYFYYSSLVYVFYFYEINLYIIRDRLFDLVILGFGDFGIGRCLNKIDLNHPIFLSINL